MALCRQLVGPYDSDCMINGLFRFRRRSRTCFITPVIQRSPSCYELRLEGAKGVLRCRGIHMSNDTRWLTNLPSRGAFFQPVVDLDRGQSGD